MTDAWGANTFHLEFVDHVFSGFSDVFLKINVGGDSARIPFLEDAPVSHASSSRRRVGCDSWRLHWGLFLERLLIIVCAAVSLVTFLFGEIKIKTIKCTLFVLIFFHNFFLFTGW